jgi:hypothetical protein
VIGLCSVADIFISITEISVSGTTVSNMDLKEVCCENGRWIEVAQDNVQWRALVLAMLNLRVLLPVLVRWVFGR